MSLIQDALKRKLEEEQFLPPKEQPATPPVVVPAPPPVVAPAPPPVVAPAPPPAAKNKPAPDSTKLLLLLVAVIVLLLIGLGIYLLLRPAAETRSAETARPEPVAVQPVVEEEKAVEEPVIEKETAPLPGVQWPELNLTGFASAGTEHLVIINGKTLSAGSRIEGVRILQIGKNEVAVEYQGEQRRLRVDNQ